MTDHPLADYQTVTPQLLGVPVHISVHAVQRFIDRIAPHMTFSGASRRLRRELVMAQARCPPRHRRPENVNKTMGSTYLYTPSCVLVYQQNTQTVVTVLAYGMRGRSRRPPRRGNRSDSKQRKRFIEQRSLRILDNLFDEEEHAVLES